MKIMILGGGESPEREISLRSAKAVAEAAREAGFEVTEADPSNKQDFVEDIDSDTIVFPILHGRGGEDGTVQKELEAHQIPYLGSTSKPSAICFDKWQTREILAAAGLPIARGEFVNRNTYYESDLIKQPYVLKIAEGGSSIGTLIAHNPEQVSDENIDEVFSLGDYAVIEELIQGIEITVPIIDGKALPVIEIKPPENEDYDFTNKYSGPTQLLCPPVSIRKDVQHAAQEIAEHAHRAAGCRHISRDDIIIDSINRPIIL
jgi:D-alanine-D-alanine ligase